MKDIFVGVLRLCCVFVAGMTCAAAAQTEPPDARADFSPPWQHGGNDDALARGLEFTEPDADNLADFHGTPTDPALSLYVGGNYFFAMAPLVQRFEALHPRYTGRIYWETLPPGLLMEQIKDGGTVTVGNMTWTVKADVYLAGLTEVQKYVQSGELDAPAVAYVTNTLTIMVAAGNPQHIRSLRDLGRPRIKLAMPNPAFEGIARQIKESLAKAGGPALVTRIYESKVRDGSAVLTHIHHRQTPLWIMQRKSQAGVTWQSEALFQEQMGHPIAHVSIPGAVNSTAVYGGALVKGAPHPQAGREWLEFLRSPDGLAVFESYGFKPVAADEHP